MSEFSSSARGGALSALRLKSYIDEGLSAHKADEKIGSEPMAHGRAPETASERLRDAMEFLWVREDGGGPIFARVGTWHMIIGTSLLAVGVGAAAATYHSGVDLWAPVSAVLFGAIFAGGVELAYGIIRLMDG
jgi:hypothetical protein